jgi:multiple sugar transport system substrate-binding protein
MTWNHLRTGIGRLGLAGIIVCLVAAPLVGCSGADTATPEPVTITFAYTDSPEDAEYYGKLIAAFNEEYPYITVELVTPGAGEPDVFVDAPFDLHDMVADGEILSLDPFIEQDTAFDRSDYYPGTLALFAREGKMWAIPAGVDIRVMYYNQELFDAYGVDYPESGWTWEDFVYRALALRDESGGVFGYVGVDAFLDALTFVYLHGGGIFDDINNPTRTTFDDPLTIEAVAWYADLIHEHNVAPTSGQLFSAPFQGSAQAGVYAGKVGMWSGWLSERGGSEVINQTWPVKWNMDWSMAPLPQDAQAGTLTIAIGYFISAEAASPEACWQWISFLSGQIPQGLMPARKSVAESNAFEVLVGADVASVARTSMESAMLPTPELLAQFGPALGLFGNALETVLGANGTAEEALSRAQQQAER